MRATPVPGERALVLDDGSRRALVVGDLHVGLEADFAKSGIRLPSRTRTMRARLDALVGEIEPRELIVIGDLKHAIPVSSFQEERELSGFFADLGIPVTLVRGNHDVDLMPLENVRVHGGSTLKWGSAILLHGHTWPEESLLAASAPASESEAPGGSDASLVEPGRPEESVPLVITCHNHPMVLLVDDLGRRHKEPCWVRAPFTDIARAKYPRLAPDARLIVVPAFNDLLGGAAFNGSEGRRLLGPLFGNGFVDVEEARLYTLDGVDLGCIRDLHAFAPDEPARRGARTLEGGVAGRRSPPRKGAAKRAAAGKSRGKGAGAKDDEGSRRPSP